MDTQHCSNRGPTRPTRSKGLVLAVACLAIASCSHNSGNAPPPGGRAARSIGPSGGVLEGPPGTQIEGIQLRIPKGALTRFVDIALSSGDALKVAGFQSIGPAVQVLASPDPGPLRKPLILRARVSPPRWRLVQDLAIFTEASEEDLEHRTVERWTRPAGKGLSLSKDRRYFESEVHGFGRFQPMLAETPRAIEDASALVASGVAELGRFHAASIRSAAIAFRGASRADPLNIEAPFFEAVARLALFFEDRSDTTAGIDSVGELLLSYGIPVDRKSVLQRLADDDWPPYSVVPPSAARFPAIVQFLQGKFRQELLAIRALLRKSGRAFAASMTPPPFLGGGAARELDYGDLMALRSALDYGLFLADFLVVSDLDIQPQLAGRLRSPNAALKTRSSFGTRRVDLMPRAGLFFWRSLGHLIEAYVSVDAESDDQRNDFLVFHPSMTEARRAALLTELRRIERSFFTSTGESLRIRHQAGTLWFSLRNLFLGSAFDLRALAPSFREYLPLGMTLKDPSIGGTFPGLSNEEALQRAMLPTEAKVPNREITIDGKFSDWPKESELLLPADPAGDAKGVGILPAVDLSRIYMARGAKALFLRIDLADDAFAERSTHAAVYGIRGADFGPKRTSKGAFLVELSFGNGKAEGRARFGKTGGWAPVELAYSGKSIEAAIPITEAVLPIRNRRLRAYSNVLDRSSARLGSDRTRTVLLRF